LCCEIFVTKSKIKGEFGGIFCLTFFREGCSPSRRAALVPTTTSSVALSQGPRLLKGCLLISKGRKVLRGLQHGMFDQWIYQQMRLLLLLV